MVSNEMIEEYESKRQEIVEENRNLVGIVLREDERKAEEYLQKLKQEFTEQCDHKVPYDMPMLTDRWIRESALYEFCRKLPKGSDLHVHCMALLTAHRLIDFLAKREEVMICVAAGQEFGRICLKAEGQDRPWGYLPLAEALTTGIVSRERLEACWTVTGASSEQNIWEYFEELFEKHSQLESRLSLFRDYYIEAFRVCCENHIQHLEIRHLFLKSEEENRADAEAILAAYLEVKKDYPDFVVSVIGAGLKYMDFDLDMARNCFESTAAVKRKIKDEDSDFIIGFDLVNEEDASRPLKEFAPMLLNLRTEYPDLPLFMHSGESLTIQSDNLIDAYLLGVSRVGHGMNLYRYPDLLKRYYDREICVECCLISNQTLRYVHDLRLHPGVEYLKRGIPVALCSDDPAYQEYEQLVDDFFAAIMCWDLGLADIKQLCMNSIMYSGLNEVAKMKLLRAWKQQWNTFISEVNL